MTTFFKKISKITQEETGDTLSQGIIFVDSQKPAQDAPESKNRNELQTEFSAVNIGIEIDDNSPKTDEPNSVPSENKESDTKEDIQKISENKVVILPKNQNESEFPEEESLPRDMNKCR